MTLAAYEATKKSGFYDKNPGRETPIMQMMGKAPTDNSKGVRLVNLPQVRDIQNEEFEKMLAGKQTAQQALDNAVSRGNAAIKEAWRNSGSRAASAASCTFDRLDCPGKWQGSHGRPAARRIGTAHAAARCASLPQPTPALPAGRAATRHHAGLLLLAGEPGPQPVDLTRDPFGLSTRFVGFANFARVLADRPTSTRSRSRRLFRWPSLLSMA